MAWVLGISDPGHALFKQDTSRTRWRSVWLVTIAKSDLHCLQVDAKEAAMPLSEYEQRVLDQLERDLGTDPKLGRTMARQTRSRGRIVLGVFGVIAGLAVLVIGAASQMVWLGVAGFAIMAAVALWALLGPRSKPEPAVKSADAKSAGAKSSGSVGSGQAQAKGKKGHTKDGRPFMTRLEERFERRREQGDL